MKDKRGSLLIGTGIGKTRVGVLAGKTLINEGLVDSILIIVPTTNLVGGWIAEFIKWGSEEILDKVRIKCIQTAYKGHTFVASRPDQVGPNPERTLLIVDEVHSTLSPQYRALYDTP